VDLKIFLGSSSSKVVTDEVRKIAAAIDSRDGFISLRWNDSDAFPTGSYTLSRLIELTHEVDAALFVFAGDDPVLHNGELAQQPRDNVLIEYGLFVGSLGPEDVAFYRLGETRTATDVAGLSEIWAPKGWNASVELRLNAWLDDVRKRSRYSQGQDLEKWRHPAIRVWQVFETDAKDPAGKKNVLEGPVLGEINSEGVQFFNDIDKNLFLGRNSVELLSMLEQWIKPPDPHWDDLIEDQNRVKAHWQTGSYVPARVAVLFNEKHTHYGGKIFVPLAVERTMRARPGNKTEETSTIIYLDLDQLPKAAFGGEQIWKVLSRDINLLELAKELEEIAGKLHAPAVEISKVKQAVALLRNNQGGPTVIELCAGVGFYSILKNAALDSQTARLLGNLLNS
jgi:hypothetical protein